MKIEWTNELPRVEGYYLIHRSESLWGVPVLVNVRRIRPGVGLEYVGGNSCFPLIQLKKEKGVKVSQRLEMGAPYES